MTTIYFEKPYVTISWDEGIQTVCLKGKGFLTSQQLREVLNKAIELLSEKQASSFLTDMREQSLIAVADQDWSNQDWAPRIVEAGLKRAAIVMPKSALTQMSVERVQQAPTLGVEWRTFGTLEAAKEWLASSTVE